MAAAGSASHGSYAKLPSAARESIPGDAGLLSPEHEQFKLEVARVLGPSPVLASLDSWEGIFHFVAGAAKAKPGTVVTIDEFPYLVDQDSALPSVIQRFWDSGAARAGNLKIILCGSAVAQMEDLLAEKTRFTGA